MEVRKGEGIRENAPIYENLIARTGINCSLARFSGGRTFIVLSYQRVDGLQ